MKRLVIGLLIVVAFLAPLLAGVIELFGDINLSTDATRNFYASFGAGAVGAVVSVMTRMRQDDGIKIDYEVGRGLVVMLGAFRPVLGAIFGTATFFALQSGVFQPTPDAFAFVPPAGTAKLSPDALIGLDELPQGAQEGGHK